MQIMLSGQIYTKIDGIKNFISENLKWIKLDKSFDVVMSGEGRLQVIKQSTNHPNGLTP